MQQKTELIDGAPRIIKVTVKLSIKSNDLSTENYLIPKDMSDTTGNHVPAFLQTFIQELKSKLKCKFQFRK